MISHEHLMHEDHPLSAELDLGCLKWTRHFTGDIYFSRFFDFGSSYSHSIKCAADNAPFVFYHGDTKFILDVQARIDEFNNRDGFYFCK